MSTQIELIHKEVTDKILHAFFKIVYPHLGYGFLEKVYENAMAIALRDLGLKVQQQVKIYVYFQGQVVGENSADLLIEDSVIVELKAVKRLIKEHEAQLLNYLRATPYEVGILLNFGPKPDFRRKVFDNSRKSITWKKYKKLSAFFGVHPRPKKEKSCKLSS
jgi:GxxExxY protein